MVFDGFGHVSIFFVINDQYFLYIFFSLFDDIDFLLSIYPLFWFRLDFIQKEKCFKKCIIKLKLASKI